MRLALVIASDYHQSPQLPKLARALEDADRFAAFLDEYDTEIEIEEFTANRDFPEQFEQSLREQPGKLDALIVYFAGCLVTAPGRDPSLILDGERLGAFALPRLRRMLEEHASRALVIIDAVAVPRDGSSLTDVLGAVGAALGRRGALNVLVNVQLAQGEATPSSSFTDLMLFCWETALKSDPSDSELAASDLFELMRGEPGFVDFEAAEYFRGHRDFDLLGDGASDVDLAEQEVSGLRLAAETEHGGAVHDESKSNGRQGSVSSGLAKNPNLPPLPPTPLPPPILPTLPSPGQRPGAPAPAFALDAKPRAGNQIDRLLRSEGLPPPLISDAPSYPGAPQAALRGLDPLQPIVPELEEELTEPGEPFAAIADEITDETPPDTAPDTDEDPAETRQLSPDSQARIEAEALSAAYDAGFIDGEDTEVTEGFGPLADLVMQARSQPLAVPPPLAGSTLPSPRPPLADPREGFSIPLPAASLDEGEDGPLNEVLPEPRATADEPMPSFAFDGFDDEGDESEESDESDEGDESPALHAHPGALPPLPRTASSVPPPPAFRAVSSLPPPPPAVSSLPPPPLGAELRSPLPPPPSLAPSSLPPPSLPPPSLPPPSLPPPSLPPPSLPASFASPNAAPVAVSSGPGGDVSEGEAEAMLEQVPPEPPPYEVCLSNGDAYFESGDHQSAAAEYEKALLHAPADQAGVVYGRLGAVSRTRGDYDGAITNYEIALELLPTDAGPLQALTELCVAQREFAAVDGYQRRFLEAQLQPEARREVWSRLVSLWRDQADDADRARAVLLEWIAELPDDLDAHRQLIASYELRGEHADAISARRRFAELHADPVQQAEELVTAVQDICRYLGDADYAVQVALEALAAHPSGLAALDAAAGLMADEQRYNDLARIYEQVVQSTDDASIQLAIGPRLGELYRDKLHAPERTITAYERVLEEDSTRVDLRRELVDLYTTRGEYALALSHCRRALKADPHDHELYRKVYALLDKVGEVDAAWNAAMVLDCLGEADINEQVVADAHRPNGLLAAKGSVPEDYWGHGLFCPERERELSEVLAAVAEVGVELRASFLRKKKRVPKLEDDKRHDPHTSTTTLAKSLLWTSKLLSVKPPQLYVLDEVPGELSAVPVDSPSALASKSLARGLSLAQLAFLWGRHLTLFRPEHYLAVFYPTVDELGVLLKASLLSGECQSLPAEDVTSEAKKLAKDLRKKLHPGSYERLRAACRSFRPEDLDARVAHWLRTVELAGGRAGLLACGDVAVATELVRRHPVRGQTPEADQVSDIMCFSVSDEYAKLRDRLGVRIA